MNGNHVVADPSEVDFAEDIATRLNDVKHGFAAQDGQAATARWLVQQQTGSRATPWYVSMHHCPAS